MKSIEIILFLLVILVILSVIAHKVTNKKNKLLSFWLGFSVITLCYSYMIIHTNKLVEYSCNNDYWGRSDYKLNGDFFIQSFGEYKCGCDLRYNDPYSIVYYNELINLFCFIAIIFSINNINMLKIALLIQALNTIIYFVTLKDYSNMNLKKSSYLFYGGLYTTIPLILLYQLK